MKIMLFALNGSWSHSNLAIRCLRPPLEREGFEVTLIEHTLKDHRGHVLEHLWQERADVYGFSCYIWNLGEMLSLAKDLKAILPTCRVVLGGPEVSFGVERFLEMPEIDCVLCGEGESTFPKLCRDIRDGKPIPRVVEREPTRSMGDDGILYRNGEETGGILYYESSRGCPFGCAYCLSSATHGVTMKSAEQTLDELLAFEALDAPCRVIKLVDRTFNANPERANRIWEGLLSEAYTKCYHFEVCASLLDEESFAILSRFPKGKIQLEFGLQSTNEETLQAVSRHIRPQAVIDAVRRVHEMGNIHVHLDLIAGLPYESYARFARSFDEAYGCCDMLQLGFLKLLHGTALRARMEEYGYACLSEPPYTVLKSNWITYGELQRLQRISEVRERYDESHRFAHALYVLMPHVPSPFGFWEGLSLYLEERDARPLQRISQPDAYRYFLEYAEKTVEGIEKERLKAALALDFSTYEHKNPPHFLGGR